MIEQRVYALEEVRVEANADTGERRLSWYPAVFDSLSEDLGGFRERIGRRAFTQTIQEDDIRGLINHDPSLVIGRNKASTLSLRVDLKGLRAEAVLPDTQYARDLATLVERGDVTGGSFAFMVRSDNWHYEDDVLIRELRDVRLFDASVVTYPAYPETNGSVSLRSLGPTADYLERIISGLRPEPVKPASDIHAARRRQLELARLRT